jgi:hypothetical protein
MKKAVVTIALVISRLIVAIFQLLLKKNKGESHVKEEEMP